MIEIKIGDCLESLKTLPDASVHCCVTSPPYYGLRDYQTASWVGGRDDCSHQVGEIRTGQGMEKLGEKYRGGGHKAAESKPIMAKDECPHCGAVRMDMQIGLEQTPDEYIAKLVDVFREIKRVLRDDGTLWVNIGDSYAGSWGNYGGQNRGKGEQRVILSGSIENNLDHKLPSTHRPATSRLSGDLKNKDMIGIPWMLAFALRADEWYLRQDIIWHKPNPMPESVRDRCTKSHEYVFLFSKNPKYYFNSEAIREPVADSTKQRLGQANLENQKGSDRVPGKTNGSMKAVGNSDFRNRRSVWSVSTKPFKGSHFAVFPPDLIEPCILAGCPEGGTVIDPFGGSGTTAGVAVKHGRKAIICELSADYVEMMPNRVKAISGYDMSEGQ